jgi:hypothetical protein
LALFTGASTAAVEKLKAVKRAGTILLHSLNILYQTREEQSILAALISTKTTNWLKITQTSGSLKRKKKRKKVNNICVGIWGVVINVICLC